MANKAIEIRTEKGEFLLSPLYKHLLAKRLVDLGLSRQQTTNWLADVITDFLYAGGIICDGEGQLIDITDTIFDDVYFDDSSFCWNSDVKRYADSMPERRSPARILPRLQLFDAAFKIAKVPTPCSSVEYFSPSHSPNSGVNCEN